MKSYINAHEQFMALCREAGGVEDETATNHANSLYDLMAPELYEEVSSIFDGFPGVSDEEFLRLYCERHLAKFGQHFTGVE